jgi:hypothetical protein
MVKRERPAVEGVNLQNWVKTGVTTVDQPLWSWSWSWSRLGWMRM